MATIDFHPSIEQYSESGSSSRTQSECNYTSEEDSETASSVKDVSPPAFLLPKNGRRNSGFWSDKNASEDMILATAASTRLPTGSLSPEKRSLSPDYQEMQSVAPAEPENTSNCMYYMSIITNQTDRNNQVPDLR